jgi:hypothetical protein
MPLIIIPAVCKEKGGPFGDPESCQKYGMGYVALSMAMGSIYIWTYVYNLMRVLSNSPVETPPSVESNYDSYKVPLISSKEEENNQKVSSHMHMISNYSFIKVGSDCVYMTGWEVGKSQAEIGFTVTKSQP